MNIAVIPARGGSKRIPRKNIRDFCGKPMIAWAIEAAQASELFEHVIVSTDDIEIADIATIYGAEVPFVRPADISNDYAGTSEVIAHATLWALDQNWPLAAVCCIYATVPFLRVEDLLRGLREFETGNWSYVFGATDFPAPIFRSFEEKPEGGIHMFFPEHFSTRSQDLPNALHDAGQFYWGHPAAWSEQRLIFDLHSTIIEIPRWRVQDIDTEEDWVRAELLHAVVRGRAS